jgi:glycosyltransferase involved in cell wall biosynthesis
MPSVDVVIPNYQYGHFLRDCVASVLQQGIPELRVLIIDNASTDDSVQIARRLAREDGRVQVIEHKTNVGRFASMNEGLDWASADYSMVLCADDLLLPGRLANAVAVLESAPDITFAFGRDLQWMNGQPMPCIDPADDPRWRIVSGARYVEERCRKPNGTVAPLVRTKIQKQVGYFLPEIGNTTDLNMFMRLASHGRVAEYSSSLAIQRLHGANLTASHWASSELRLHETLQAFEVFFANEGGSLKEARRLRSLARRNLGERAYWSALSHAVRHRDDGGASLFRMAFTLSPRTKLVPPVGQLLMIERPFDRAKQILLEGLRRFFWPSLVSE